MLPSEGASPAKRGIADYPILVPGCLAQEQCQRIMQLGDQIYDSLGTRRNGEWVDTGFRALGVRMPRDKLPKVHIARVEGLLRSFMSPAGGFSGIQPLLGDEFYFLLAHCFIRRRNLSDPVDHNVWHYDADFMGQTGEMINVWLPFKDVGSDLPGLTFLKNAADRAHCLATYQDWARTHWTVNDRSRVVPEFKDTESLAGMLGHALELHTPLVAAGDALVFNQMTLHRTQEVEATEGVRPSIELRMCRADAIPEVYRETKLPVVRVRGSGQTLSLELLDSV